MVTEEASIFVAESRLRAVSSRWKLGYKEFTPNVNEGEVLVTRIRSTDRSKFVGDEGSEMVSSDGSFVGTNDKNIEGELYLEDYLLGI